MDAEDYEEYIPLLYEVLAGNTELSSVSLEDGAMGDHVGNGNSEGNNDVENMVVA
ncbi:hypothetical protein TRIUR3_12778 [Triticum urartu]|uniref:Uncharacterized protein n=1 Tax=Triticum urartu TaxID=4572 RepID=M7YLK7_TRIUA|nr:hypothetical protein TRIUR3_12778 [Triticum urartu]